MEQGEILVIHFDRIKETLRNVDGRLYVTNYRVSKIFKQSNFEYFTYTISFSSRLLNHK